MNELTLRLSLSKHNNNKSSKSNQDAYTVEVDLKQFFYDAGITSGEEFGRFKTVTKYCADKGYNTSHRVLDIQALVLLGGGLVRRHEMYDYVFTTERVLELVFEKPEHAAMVEKFWTAQ